jgi:hypothetical protein
VNLEKLKISLKVTSEKLKISLKCDQVVLSKMGQIMFSVSGFNLSGFSCIKKILYKNIWKNGLPGGWSTKIG